MMQYYARILLVKTSSYCIIQVLRSQKDNYLSTEVEKPFQLKENRFPAPF